MKCLIISTSVCDIFEVIKIVYLTEQWRNISCNRRRQRYDAKEVGYHQTEMLKPLANRSNVALLDVTCYLGLHTLLHVVACCRELLHKVWNRSNLGADNSQHFFCSVIAKAWRNNNVGGKLIKISRDCQSINQSINQYLYLSVKLT